MVWRRWFRDRRPNSATDVPELSEVFENLIMSTEARIKPPLEKLEVDMGPVMGRIVADMGEMKVAMTKLNSRI